MKNISASVICTSAEICSTRLASLFIAVVSHASTFCADSTRDKSRQKASRKNILCAALLLAVLQSAGLFAATVSPTSLSWASVPVGGKGAQKAVTLTNTATTAITISSVTLTGTNAGDFQIFSKTCGTSLAASASCSANIVFAPTSSGTRTAVLNFTDSASGSPQKVTLSGTGIGTSGTVALTPNSLAFGSVTLGATSASQTTTLRNGGSTSITVSSISVTGTNPGDFLIGSKTCGNSLAAGASCTVTVAFKPTVAGTRSAALTVSDNASNSPQQAALSGTGASSSGGNVTVAPSSLSFGNTAVGVTSSAQTVTMTNGTKATVTIHSVAISGANASSFAISSKTCGTSLAAAASCAVNVTFRPGASGGFSANLVFTDSAAGSPRAVALSGSSSSNSGFTINPMNPVVVVNEALQFSATTDVTWSASCGSIGSTSGVYTAPSTTGSCTVTATETGGTHATDSTLVKVNSSPSSGKLAVYPTTAAVYTGTEQIFQAQLTLVPDGHSLTYSIDGVVDGNSTTGTITNQGVYVAPNVAGTHHLTVRDNSLGTTATATINIFSKVSVDFASRSASMHAVPAHFFGGERFDSLRTTADLDLVKAGGITYARFYAQMPNVFKSNSTPNWNAIDPVIQRISAGGVKVILQIYQTPIWLQPKPNPCGTGNFNALPTDLNAWGELAAQYVKHMDGKFPGVVTDYEIWNEPNTTALCVSATSRLPDYMKLYAAAAPQMRAQARQDGSTARVGGPATAGMQSTWVNAMLADPVISQNIDFLSYHDYMFNNVQLGAQWDTYNGVTSVYQKTQNTGNGPLNVYLYATRLVAQGKQPQGRNLPIYNTEFNLNWDFAKNCCANDYVYSPVWNGLYIADVLNSIYVGAPNVPNHMVYFAAIAHPYFCLVGEIDANMDCTYPTSGSPQPYPQYFLYQLMGADNYLGLQEGGHMAASISPPIAGNGLVVTAYFTANLDAIVLINPTQDRFTNIPVSMTNTGYSASQATLYQIVNGRSIQSSSISLQSQGGTSYTTSVTIEPYSVQAIAIR